MIVNVCKELSDILEKCRNYWCFYSVFNALPCEPAPVRLSDHVRYFGFCTGNPDDGDQAYGYVYSDWKWADLHCSETNVFICETLSGKLSHQYSGHGWTCSSVKHYWVSYLTTSVVMDESFIYKTLSFKFRKYTMRHCGELGQSFRGRLNSPETT